MTATISSKVNELNVALACLTHEGDEINLKSFIYLFFSDFEPETYWDRMQFFQEAILYRLVLFSGIFSTFVVQSTGNSWII